MRRTALLDIALGYSILLIGCSQDQLSDKTERSENQELRRLYKQDQADRKEGVPAGERLSERDQERRQRVQAILEAGEVNTADDYFHAAMIFQ